MKRFLISDHPTYLRLTLILLLTLRLTRGDAPRNLVIVGKTENALFIEWTPPSGGYNGQIRGYQVTATPISSHTQSLGVVRSFEWLDEPGLHSSSLVSLEPGTEYEVVLVALFRGGGADGVAKSAPVSVKGWTRIGTPDEPQPPRLLWMEGNRMSLSLTPAKNSKGPISFYRLALVDDRQLGFNKETIVGWQEATQLHFPYYIAAQWDDPYYLPSSFTVGSGEKVGGFYNGGLPSHGHWHPALGVGSTFENVTKIQYSSTGHFQHDHLRLSEDGRYGGGGGGRAGNVIVEDGGLVTGLWIAIGATSILLIVVLVFFLLLKLNLVRSKGARRRRESHPLSHTNQQRQMQAISTISGDLHYSNEFADCGGYTHLSYVPEEEDWGRKALIALTALPCIPRASVQLPDLSQTHSQTQRQDGEVDNGVVLLANGHFGPVFASLQSGKRPVELYQLPIPSGGRGSRSTWDEASFRALNSLLQPSSHVNVASLDGFLETDVHLFLVVSGDGVTLKTELLRSRQSSTTEKCAQGLLLCAMGIAEGLFHLHSYNLNHGELCSWSVLLPRGEDWANPKLTGFGLLSSNPINKERDRNRWMSVEQLHSRTAPPSDSWSFGVLLWEICTLGSTPLYDIKTEDVKRRVERGARPPQLEIHGDGLYQLMLSCWQIDREERPDPETLACQLHQLLPTANEELGLWESFKWPPYIESLEFLPNSTK